MEGAGKFNQVNEVRCMRVLRVVGVVGVAAALAATAMAGDPAASKRFEWSTDSAEAKQLLGKLQDRIESFQAGPENQEIAKKIVAADADFAMGHYYLSAVTPPPDGLTAYEKARELSTDASDGERRFIEAMSHVVTNQGANFADSIPPLEELSKDYQGERLIFVILGQLYNAVGRGDDAIVAFEKVREIGPPSLRVESFIAGDDLLHERYAEARATYASIEKKLPEGSVPFAIRFGTTFSHLYEGQVDEALASLESYLEEYRGSGANQQFPEVFIHNAMARINLENGRFDAASEHYKKGYESVPGSELPEDQKKTWLGRMLHGECRVLAKMAKHEEAWKEAEVVRGMIEEGGEPAEQFWPAYHYLAGYVLYEAGRIEKAIEHLEQANPQDPFHKLLLARSLEKAGKKDEAKKVYEEIVASQWTGIERALAYPEAKKKANSL